MTAPKELYSPEEVAETLGLHVRTVRRLIREGKIRATRIGKQYRVPAAALAEVTGSAGAALPSRVPRTRDVRVSTIVDIDAIDRPEADRVTTVVTAVFNSAREGTGRKRIDTMYYEEQGQLRIVLHGAPGFTASLLTMLEGLLADATRR